MSQIKITELQKEKTKQNGDKQSTRAQNTGYKDAQ